MRIGVIAPDSTTRNSPMKKGPLTEAFFSNGNARITCQRHRRQVQA